MARKTYTPGLATFEEDVLRAVWKEPYLFEQHTRASLEEQARAKEAEV